jgi:hypothetical protein
MAAQDRLVEQCQPLLPAGITIEHAFVCQTARYPWLFIVNYLTYLTIFWIRFRVVCVTDDAIYVLRGSKFAVRPREVVATLPRATRFGPVSGRWAQIELLGNRHWVHKRFHDEVRATDRAAPLRSSMDG